MKKKNLGRKIYLPNSQQIGTVTTVDKNGVPETAQIGDNIVDVSDKVIFYIGIILKVYAFIRDLIKR